MRIYPEKKRYTLDRRVLLGVSLNHKAQVLPNRSSPSRREAYTSIAITVKGKRERAPFALTL